MNELWNFNDLEVTRQRFEERLHVARSEGRASNAAAALTQLARIDGLERAFEAAESKLTEARALAPDDVGVAARIALETGRLARDQGDVAAAEQQFETALQLARQAGEDALALDSLHMLAISAPPDRALQLATTAEGVVAAGAPSLRAWLGPFLNNLGWTLCDAGRHEEAISCFHRDAALRAELGATGERQIADWNAGLVLRLSGRIEEARAVQTALEAEIGPAGDGIAFVLEELAELAAAGANRVRAQELAARAIDAHRASGLSEANDPDRFARLVALRDGGQALR